MYYFNIILDTIILIIIKRQLLKYQLFKFKFRLSIIQTDEDLILKTKLNLKNLYNYVIS